MINNSDLSTTRGTKVVRSLLETVRARDLARQKRVDELKKQTWSRKSSRAATWCMWTLFAILIGVLGTTLLRTDTPSYLRVIGIGTYYGAMIAAFVGTLADGVAGLMMIFNPMKHAFKNNMESILSDYELEAELAIAAYREQLPQVANALKEEAAELEARRDAMYGMIDKVGLWPLVAGGIAGAGQLGKGDAWPGVAAVAFVLFVNNISMLNFAKTLRRCAAVCERAERLLPAPAQRSSAE